MQDARMRYKILSREEVNVFITDYQQNGCIKSRDAVVESQLAFCKSLAYKWCAAKHWNNYDAALSATHVALMIVIDKFDVTRGVALHTFLRSESRTTLRTAYREEHGVIRTPTPTKENPHELIRKVVSVSIEAGHTGGEIGDLLLPGTEEDALGMMVIEEDKWQLQVALDSLDERSRRILMERFIDEKTLHEIGQRLGITRERVRQIQNRAIKDVRAIIKMEKTR